MFKILYFFQGGWPIVEKGGVEKIRGIIYKEEGLESLGKCVIFDTRVI